MKITQKVTLEQGAMRVTVREEDDDDSNPEVRVVTEYATKVEED